MGKLNADQQDPRDTYLVSSAKSRKPPQATRAIRQSMSRHSVPPERMPLPPLKPNMQGNICPSRQNVPAQYFISVSGGILPSRSSPISTAATIFSISVRITASVRGPPKVR